MEKKGIIFNIQKFSINDGPGIRTTVFFKGCPLQCRWCSNPESQNRFMDITDSMDDLTYKGRENTIEEVMKVVRQDIDFYRESGGGITLSGGEPLWQAEFAIELAKTARSEGIHVASETTGMAPKETFEEFIGNLDMLLMDFKHADSNKHMEFTGVPNEIIIDNFKIAFKSGIDIAVRIPVIPGFNNDMESGKLMANKLVSLGAKTVHLLPFHQFGESKYEKLGVEYPYSGFKQMHPEQLESYYNVYKEAGLDVFFK